jgi:hypothetical protein
MALAPEELLLRRFTPALLPSPLAASAAPLAALSSFPHSSASFRAYCSSVRTAEFGFTSGAAVVGCCLSKKWWRVFTGRGSSFFRLFCEFPMVYLLLVLKGGVGWYELVAFLFVELVDQRH